MRKYQRAIAHNLMQLDGIPRVNKRIPRTRSSFFSLYWKGWQDKLIERYYSPKKSRRRRKLFQKPAAWPKGGTRVR